MIFDENTPKSSQFQKPIFGGKTLLRKADGSRTGLSYGLSGALGWMSGLSPLGSKFGQQLDNLVQGGKRPDYLMDQDWYANNVRESEGKANSISTITGGAGEAVRSIAETVAGVMTGGASTAITGGLKSAGKSITEAIAPQDMGPFDTPVNIGSTNSLKFNPIKPSEDPNVSFRDMLSRRSNQVMTSEQRRMNEIQSRRQMNLLPTQDENFWGTQAYSDTPPFTPNFSKIMR
jgi:hypothetical protein